MVRKVTTGPVKGNEPLVHMGIIWPSRARSICIFLTVAYISCIGVYPMPQSYTGKCQLTLTLGPRFPHQISIWALGLDRLSRVDLMWGRQPWWWTAHWALITRGRLTSPNFACRAGQKDWSRAGHCSMIRGCSSCSPPVILPNMNPLQMMVVFRALMSCHQGLLPRFEVTYCLHLQGDWIWFRWMLK